MTIRILMLSSQIPFPSTNGGLVRIASIFKGLSQYYAVELMAPITSRSSVKLPKSCDSAIVNPVLIRRSYTQTIWKLIRFGVTNTPLHSCLYVYPEMIRAVASRLQRKKYDAVYCHLPYSLEYLPSWIDVPIILDTQNDFQEYWERKIHSSTGLKRVLSAWNLHKTKHYEQKKFSNLWVHISVSESDRQLAMMRARYSIPNYLVAYNGVDTKVYTPVKLDKHSTSNLITLAFLGSLDIDINIDGALRLCTAIFPKVQSRMPDKQIKLLIIGRNPPQVLQTIDQQDPNIIVTGTVPNVQPWLRQADILIAPLYQGAGTKLRVLEAMSCALPVIGTEFALQGIHGQDGTHFVRAKDDAHIVEHILDLIANFDRRQSIGKNARELMKTKYDWSMINNNLAGELSALWHAYQNK